MICLVLMLLEDDLEDALDLVAILLYFKKRRLDDLLTGLNSAPIIGADFAKLGIDAGGQG